MVFSPDRMKLIPLTELAKLGLAASDVRGIEFNPPPGARGLNAKMKVTMWQATLTHLDAARPMIRAIRENPDEAEHDARALFVTMMTKKPGEPFSPVSTPAAWTASAKVKTTPKPAAKAAEPATDDDVDDLI